MSESPPVPSVIGRLLAELSWSGSTIRQYRDGGHGFENVLTAEALQALDLLPRRHFLGEVIRGAVGADAAREKLRTEVEALEFTLLPGNFYLRPSEASHQTKLAVQPDGVLCSSKMYVILEAKRLRRGSFQEAQLAREYMLVHQQCGAATPIFLLLLPELPPVPIRGNGRMEVAAAITAHLPKVFAATETPRFPLAELLERVPQVVCWTTWSNLSNTLVNQLNVLAVPDASHRACIERLVAMVSNAITWHR